MTEKPPILELRVEGPLACFSRPEFSVERASYPWITPSAARALFEAVLWKPRIRYEIRKIAVLKPIRFTSIRRNEIKDRIPSKGLDRHPGIRTDQWRQQRNTLALVDVAYQVTAELWLNAELPPMDKNDNHGKYRECFLERLSRGQCFHRPYLGMREFVADLHHPKAGEHPIADSLPHGLMLYDFLYPTSPDNHRVWRRGQKPRPLYFEAIMRQGQVEVPSRAEVLARLPRGAA